MVAVGMAANVACRRASTVASRFGVGRGVAVGSSAGTGVEVAAVPQASANMAITGGRTTNAGNRTALNNLHPISSNRCRKLGVGTGVSGELYAGLSGAAVSWKQNGAVHLIGTESDVFVD